MRGICFSPGGHKYLEFLNRLVRQSERKVFLIVDRHPVHRAKKVKQWLAEHSEQIRFFYLPGYSPEINPDELLNQDVKSNTIRKNRFSQQTSWSKIFGAIYVNAKCNLISWPTIFKENTCGTAPLDMRTIN